MINLVMVAEARQLWNPPPVSGVGGAILFAWFVLLWHMLLGGGAE